MEDHEDGVSSDVVPEDGGEALLSGEELYVRARAMVHRAIPTFNTDAPYLNLLGRAAQKGYPRAMTKLGDYAMRRSAFVEAYYWMSRAKRHGMGNLEPVMRKIRRLWVSANFPKESHNSHPLFSHEAGSIGLALLHLDSGHQAAQARAFLRTYHPEFLRKNMGAD